MVEQLEIPRVDAPVPPPQPGGEDPTVPSGHPTGRPIGLPTAAVGAGAGPVGPGGTRALQRPWSPPAPAARTAGPHLLARRRSRRIFVGWVAVVVLLAVLVATAAWWLGSGRWTEMPSVVGLPETTAQQLLAEADLLVTTTRGGDGRAAEPAGHRHRPAPRNPPAARHLGDAHRLHRPPDGAGDRPRYLPPRTPRRRSGKPGWTRTPTGTTPSTAAPSPEGAVLRTSPGAGTEVDRGATVRLVLSRGEEPAESDEDEQVRVPFLIGSNFDEAREKLVELGLEVERRSRSGIGGRVRDRLGEQFGSQVLQQSHGPGLDGRPGHHDHPRDPVGPRSPCRRTPCCSSWTWWARSRSP